MFRLVLGCLLLYDSLLKMRHPYGFLAGIYELGLVGPKAGVLAVVVLPWMELLAGLALVGGLFEAGALLASMFVLTAYVAASAAVFRWKLPVNYGLSPLGRPLGAISLLWMSPLLALSAARYAALVAAPTLTVSAVCRACLRACKTTLSHGRSRLGWAVGSGVIVLGATLTLAALSSDPIAFDATSIRIPELEEGQAVQRDFVFRNVGDKAAQVLEVRSTCTCISARAVAKTVEPHGSGIIRVRLNATGLDGQHEYPVFIHTDVEGQEVIELSVRVFVRRRG